MRGAELIQKSIDGVMEGRVTWLNDKYEVIDRKQGGMGELYICLDKSKDNKIVALKTYRSDLERTEKIRELFIREAQAWIKIGSGEFTYDPVGNRLTGPAYPKPSTYLQSYAYDYENRIVRATRQATGNPDADIVTFKYDPFGRRTEKTVSTVENGIPTTYKYAYVYDSEDIILEILDKTQNGSTVTTTTAYVHGPGIDEPLSLERNSQKYYYHADGLGSITSMTDSTQAVVNRYSYDSFGMVQRAETVWNDFTYTGREYDSETDLYYYRARYYDPEAGRFVSKDPIGFAGGDVNVYGYTSGNPVNWVDPWGLSETILGVYRDPNSLGIYRDTPVIYGRTEVNVSTG